MSRSLPPPPVVPVGPLVNIEVAAEQTGLSVHILRRAVKSGRLAAYRPSGGPNGPLAFSTQDLNTFIATTRVG